MDEVQHDRHFLLTLYLVALLFFNFIIAWYYFAYAPNNYHILYPHAPTWHPYIIGVCSLFNIVSLLALFKWSFWGFWGYCLSDVIKIFMNVTFKVGTVGHAVMMPALVLFLLFVFLNIGGKNKAWDQLKY